MIKITKNSFAGTLESSDCLVTITPNKTENVNFEINSVVFKQYGNLILKAAKDTVKKFEITGADIKIQDMGAFDCVIEARVETAIKRAFSAMKGAKS